MPCSFFVHLNAYVKPVVASRFLIEINKLLKVGFIRPVKKATWLSLIVILPKKNGKIRVCVDYRKMDGFSGYNHI